MRGVLALALVLAGSALAAPEAPEGYRLEAYRAPVPETLEGGAVIETAAAHALWRRGEAVFVDVLPRPPRPDNLPEDTLWRPKPRRSIPGSVWLPDVGYGALSPEMDAYFREELARAAGSRERKIVFFCLAECWMSWNAARRAIREYGYERVHWYPGGTDRWSEAGHPLERVEAVPR